MMHIALCKHFESAITSEQADSFIGMCESKFPQGYNNPLDTIDEIQTDVYLILEFIRRENIEW